MFDILYSVVLMMMAVLMFVVELMIVVVMVVLMMMVMFLVMMLFMLVVMMVIMHVFIFFDTFNKDSHTCTCDTAFYPFFGFYLHAGDTGIIKLFDKSVRIGQQFKQCCTQHVTGSSHTAVYV